MIASIETPRAAQRAKRDAWNEAHEVGTFVRVWQSLPAGDWLVTRTKSAAFLHGHGVAVQVGFCVAPIYLTNLEPISAAALAALTHDDTIEQLNRECLTPATKREIQQALAQLPRGDRGEEE